MGKKKTKEVLSDKQLEWCQKFTQAFLGKHPFMSAKNKSLCAEACEQAFKAGLEFTANAETEAKLKSTRANMTLDLLLDKDVYAHGGHMADLIRERHPDKFPSDADLGIKNDHERQEETKKVKEGREEDKEAE